jgi:hypothetical protein
MKATFTMMLLQADSGFQFAGEQHKHHNLLTNLLVKPLEQMKRDQR